MASTELDLKYRPRRFSEVVGNAAIVRLLLIRSRGGTLSGRSMMFGGPKGCGKTSLARIAALAIVCDELSDGEPCGACLSCQAVMADGSMVADEFDAATGGTVDRIRSIVDDLEYGTVNGKPRVVILDEAQRLSKAAQDALLKSVEDRRFVLILCTTEPHKIGEAIRSRVEEYSVSPPSVEEITDRLYSICRSEGIQASPDSLTLLSQHLKCCPRECISAVETLSGLGPVTDATVRSHLRFDSYEAVGSVLSLVDSDPSAALSALDPVIQREGPTWVRDVMVQAVTSSIRQAVGAKPTYPVPLSFFGSRRMGWADLASSLGRIEKPTAADVENALLSGSRAPMVSSVLAPPSPLVAPPPPIDKERLFAAASKVPDPGESLAAGRPAPKAVVEGHIKKSEVRSKPDAAVRRVMSIEGVHFSSTEELTTLDSKIERGTRGAPVKEQGPRAGVELDGAHLPVPEKDFARGFIQRYKKDSSS